MGDLQVTKAPGLPALATPPVDAAPADLRRSLRTPILSGLAVIIAFFVAFGGWAAMAPLASAAIAPGVISPDGSRRTVQHLEGGIIGEILVKDGDVVAAGDPLVVLEDIQARAAYDQLLSQHTALAATRARLLSEQAGRRSIDFPTALLERAGDDPGAAKALAVQADLFHSRQQSLENQKAILRQRIAQLEEEIGGLRAQIRSQRTQLRLIASEIEGVETLLDKGLERRPRLLALQRSQAEIEGARAANLAAIARSDQAIGEAKLEILNLDAGRSDEIADLLAQVQGDLATVEEKLRASKDVLNRTVISAPVAGTIVQLRYKTTGGVIGPGEPILDIVPQNDELLIDARVKPVDIDSVHPGLEAQIHLTAYRQRNLPRIDGTVRTVSADALVDEKTGEAYYLARVEVDRQALEEVAPNIELVSGMPAEVLIVTGERTALAYFIRPFLESLNRAFRES